MEKGDVRKFLDEMEKVTDNDLSKLDPSDRAEFRSNRAELRQKIMSEKFKEVTSQQVQELEELHQNALRDLEALKKQGELISSIANILRFATKVIALV